MVPNWNSALEGRDKSDLLLDSLRASKLNFYLTGSRYFGGATLSSDWDFFVQDSQETQAFLNFARFNYATIFVSKHVNPSSSKHLLSSPQTFAPSGSEKTENPYSDHNCAEVWRWQNVDIQVVADIQLKLKAQEEVLKLLRSGWEMPADKRKRRKVWETAYRKINLRTLEQRGY